MQELIERWMLQSQKERYLPNMILRRPINIEAMIRMVNQYNLGSLMNNCLNPYGYYDSDKPASVMFFSISGKLMFFIIS